MRKIILLTLALVLLSSTCHALTGARLRMTQLSCTAVVTGETGDTANYFSDWSLTGGSCGTIYYTADWDGYGWTISLYTDAGHTHLVGQGSDMSISVTIIGTIHGTVTAQPGPEGNTSETGTLTRGLVDWTSKPPAGTALRTDGHWSVTGLVGAWPLNEGSGTTVTNMVDSVTGSLTNATFAGGDVAANANGYIETNTTVPTDFTIVTEISFAGTTDDTLFYAHPVESTANTFGAVKATSTYAWYWKSVSQTFSTMTPTGTGVADIVAVTKSGTTYNLYKNGSASTPTTRTYTSANTTLHFGNVGSPRTGSAKIIKWGLLYNRALSSTEIESLSANPWQVFAPH